MPTTIFNTTRSASATYTVAVNEDVVLGRDAFWDNTITVNTAMLLSGINTLFVAGQMYSDRVTINSTTGFNRIDITATGILSASVSSVMTLKGTANHVSNAGHISGTNGIVFDTSENTVVNSGTINALGDAIQFGGGIGNTTITNSGALISSGDDGLQVQSDGTTTILNTGTISAPTGSAVIGFGSGLLQLTNTGTISGLEAFRGYIGVDRITNSGVMSGRVTLSSGDDFFDTSLGITIGIVDGGVGNDTLIGSALEDRLEGDVGNDTLSGNDGNDLLSGGAGADDLDGGAGSDTASYRGALGLTIDLADASRNTGEALGDTFVSIENIIGTEFVDTVYGDAERNRLRGDEGDDVLDGRGGADRMVGGTGSDTFFVDDRADRVVELVNEGTDTVTATISFALSDFVEELVLTGTAALSGTGNASANQIFGNTGANIIDGQLGNDFLSGGGGADQFRFTTALDALNNVDTILDFTPGADKIALSRTVFNPLGGGAAGLQAAAFVTGTAAGDANDRIIYDSATGRLFYDPDGDGAIAQTLFARLDTNVVLTPTDFIVFG